jgi:hypothetical protein
MHVFARWQHLDLDLSATDLRTTKFNKQGFEVYNTKFGKGLSTSFESSSRRKSTFQIKPDPSGGFFFGACPRRHS